MEIIFFYFNSPTDYKFSFTNNASEFVDSGEPHHVLLLEKIAIATT